MRVVFLVEHPFGERDYQRFGVALLQANGFSVEVWDLTPWLKPEVHRGVTLPDPIAFPGMRLFQTWPETRSAIAGLDPSSWVVANIGYTFDALPVFRALTRASASYGVVTTNSIPPAVETESHPQWARWKRLLRLKPTSVWRRLVLHAARHGRWIRPADWALVGGAASASARWPMTRTTRIIWAHALDYDLYLQIRNSPAAAPEAYGVFLDEYVPFHPDFIHLGIQPPVSADEYYPRLSRLFDDIERRLGIRMVIAAHPRASYERHPDYFGGRPVLRGQTPDLVRQARLVVAHASTAVSFAVLFEKPVLFVTTDRLQQSALLRPAIATMAAWLGKRPVNLDAGGELDWAQAGAVDSAAYARYREAYIKRPGTPDLPAWQIFADFGRERAR